MMNRSWPLAAATLSITLWAGGAGAQTVYVSKAPAGATLEVVLNTTTAGSATISPSGEATVPLKLQAITSKTEIDASLYVDTCENLRRVLVIERGTALPPEGSCTRQQIEGLFLVRRVSTLVLNLGGTVPTVLLRQGSYNPREPTAWTGVPIGLMVSGGGALASFRDLVEVQCGNVSQCDGDNSVLALSASVGYWITPNIAAEVAYLRPREMTIEGSLAPDTRFDTSFDAHVLTVTGNGGVPIGRVRPFGKGGLSYHRASLLTNQTIGTVSQMIELETKGWSWTFGGGAEIWLTRRFAIYGEVDWTQLAGDSVFEGEGRLDDRITAIVAGGRFRIGG
jgi:hypothetical protein